MSRFLFDDDLPPQKFPKGLLPDEDTDSPFEFWTTRNTSALLNPDPLWCTMVNEEKDP